MNNRIWYVMVATPVIILSFLFFFFDLNTKYTPTDAEASAILRIGYTADVGNFLFLIAINKEYFAEEEITIIPKKFNSYKVLTDNIYDNNLNGRIISQSDVPMSFNKKNQLPFSGILVVHYSNGDQGVVSLKKSPDLSKAKGKIIACDEGSKYVVSKALMKVGLNYEDSHHIMFKDTKDTLTALKDGKADYAYTKEPYMSDFLKNGNRLDYSTEEDPFVFSEILFIDNKQLIDNPKLGQGLIRAYFKAYTYWQENKEEAERLGAKLLHMDIDEFRKKLLEIAIPGLDDQTAAFLGEDKSKSIIYNLRDINQFNVNNDGINGMKTDELINSKYILEGLDNQNK